MAIKKTFTLGSISPSRCLCLSLCVCVCVCLSERALRTCACFLLHVTVYVLVCNYGHHVCETGDVKVADWL